MGCYIVGLTLPECSVVSAVTYVVYYTFRVYKINNEPDFDGLRLTKYAVSRKSCQHGSTSIDLMCKLIWLENDIEQTSTVYSEHETG